MQNDENSENQLWIVAKTSLLSFYCKSTGFLWLVPCSSKVEKFGRIIAKKKEKHKLVDTIKIVTLFGNRTALLFQNIFPTTEQYITSEYIKGGKSVRISGPNIIAALEKNGGENRKNDT